MCMPEGESRSARRSFRISDRCFALVAVYLSAEVGGIQNTFEGAIDGE